MLADVNQYDKWAAAHFFVGGIALPLAWKLVMPHYEPVEEKISDAIRPMIEAMGFRLVRVKVSGNRTRTIQIMAERPDGSMDVDDCAEISRAVSVLLDVEEPISGQYTLEVSSPGIDRPLMEPVDVQRFIGHVAKIKLAVPMNGRKNFVGRLLDFKDDEVLLAVEADSGERAETALPWQQIADAKLVLTQELIDESLKNTQGGQPH